IGAADTDVDDVADWFAGVAFPFTAADTRTEVTQLGEYRVCPWNSAYGINEDGCAPWSTQRHVQDCHLFSVVDLRSPKHGIDPRLQTRFLCKLCKELEGVVGDPIL